MGNLVCIIDGITDGFRSVWQSMPCRKKIRKPVVLLVAGLDNAGKSAVVNYLFNKSLLTKEKVVPTIGFRTVAFNYKSFSIRLYDVGGGPQIRALWPKYYDDVYGVIYVVDANDIDRLAESAEVFQELVCHRLISQKPILFLGNKQDLEDAVDEIDLIETMNIERVVNFAKCFTRIEICSCVPDKTKHFNLNKNIDKGFDWLLDVINIDYERLERKRQLNRIPQRSFRTKSWAAQRVENPFDYSDTDSETYIKPQIPRKNVKHKKRKMKKRRSFKNLFYLSHNRTAPMLTLTTQSMRDLIQSITIEDLMKSTDFGENNTSEYRRPRRRPRKRPNTAPSAIKPPDNNGTAGAEQTPWALLGLP